MDLDTLSQKNISRIDSVFQVKRIVGIISILAKCDLVTFNTKPFLVSLCFV